MPSLPTDILARFPLVGAGDALLGSADAEAPDGAMIVVDDGSGPHATPAAFTVAAGRVWCTTARSAYKVRAIRRASAVAMLLARRGGGWISVSGSANVLDAFRPHDSVRAIGDVARSGLAAARYLGEHPDELLGYAMRAGQVPLDWLPPQRALIAVDPRRVLVIEASGEIAKRRGRWSTMLPRPERANVALPILVSGPDWARDRVDQAGMATVGWAGDDGLIAMPANWHGDRADFDIPTALLQAAGTPASAPVAITLLAPDREAGPTGKCGVCLRGTATVTSIGPERAEASLALDRIHWWHGFTAGTLSPR